VKKPAKASRMPKKDSVERRVADESANRAAPTSNAPTLEVRSMA
jgi:hypothetical protein